MSRVLQLIDTLDAGGAERLAVSYANVLVEAVEASFLCTTRAEGLLKATINDDVGYLFLKKQSRLDLSAMLRLKQYVKTNHITTIHAHSTSFFIATLVKLLYPKVQVIWHDHYGQSEFLAYRPKRVLQLCSRFFKHIFCVNQTLVKWSQEHLNCKNVSYLQNFAILNTSKSTTTLKGELGKRILCLANLRPQKDHLNVLKAFKEVVKLHDSWTLHCVGKDFEDAYSKEISKYITDNNLTKHVFLYGSCLDIQPIISKCDIGVLASKSEGLPISLLEYALGELAVITTDVGDCHLIVSSEDKGKLIPPNKPDTLKKAFLYYIENKKESTRVAKNLKAHVLDVFSQSAVVKALLHSYNY